VVAASPRGGGATPHNGLDAQRPPSALSSISTLYIGLIGVEFLSHRVPPLLHRDLTQWRATTKLVTIGAASAGRGGQWVPAVDPNDATRMTRRNG
jgi:hypothetical protein